MKVTIDENRVLTVSAETPVEALALRYWMDGYNQGDVSLSSLTISAKVEPTEAGDGCMQKAAEA